MCSLSSCLKIINLTYVFIVLYWHTVVIVAHIWISSMCRAVKTFQNVFFKGWIKIICLVCFLSDFCVSFFCFMLLCLYSFNAVQLIHSSIHSSLHSFLHKLTSSFNCVQLWVDNTLRGWLSRSSALLLAWFVTSGLFYMHAKQSCQLVVITWAIIYDRITT